MRISTLHDLGESSRDARPWRYCLREDETAGSEAACDNSCSSCDPCCGSFLHPNCCKVADLGDPWKLFDRCFFKEHNIQAGGWLAQSFTWNPDSPDDRYNGPVTWTDRSNEYQLNELYFYLGQAAEHRRAAAGTTATAWT